MLIEAFKESKSVSYLEVLNYIESEEEALPPVSECSNIKNDELRIRISNNKIMEYLKNCTRVKSYKGTDAMYEFGKELMATFDLTELELVDILNCQPISLPEWSACVGGRFPINLLEKMMDISEKYYGHSLE